MYKNPSSSLYDLYIVSMRLAAKLMSMSIYAVSISTQENEKIRHVDANTCLRQSVLNKYKECFPRSEMQPAAQDVDELPSRHIAGNQISATG